VQTRYTSPSATSECLGIQVLRPPTTNALGRFLLTHELLPLLERAAPARVMVVTAPHPDRLNFDDLMTRTVSQQFAVILILSSRGISACRTSGR
jgi:hypothetical protein